MTLGFSTANLANKFLDMIRGVAFTAPAATFVKLHTADPGASGATAPSAVTTRVALTFAAASAGVLAMNGTAPVFTMTGAETISHFSVWDASSAGNFLWSAVLTTPKTVANTDTITFTAVGVSLAPLAA